MLFGRGNPWGGQSWGAPKPASQSGVPQVNPGTSFVQQPQGFQQPQWPQQTPDMGYAQQLAQHYASQLPNQQVPGSLPPIQTPQPVGTPLPPMGGQMGGFDRSAFQNARQDWRSQRPQDRSMMQDWRSARPQRQSFFGQ